MIYGNDKIVGTSSLSDNITGTYFSSFGLKYQIKSTKMHSQINVSESVEGVTNVDWKFRHLKTVIGGDLLDGHKFYYVLGAAICAKIFLLEDSYTKLV